MRRSAPAIAFRRARAAHGRRGRGARAGRCSARRRSGRPGTRRAGRAPHRHRRRPARPAPPPMPRRQRPGDTQRRPGRAAIRPAAAGGAGRSIAELQHAARNGGRTRQAAVNDQLAARYGRLALEIGVVSRQHGRPGDLIDAACAAALQARAEQIRVVGMIEPQGRCALAELNQPGMQGSGPDRIGGGWRSPA